MVRREESRENALAWAKENNQKYKVELINDLPEGEQISFYDMVTPDGKVLFADLCKGPHVESMKEIGAFKLIRVAGAYWRGDEKREMLRRTKYVWLKRRENLTEWQAERRRALAPNRSHLKTARACQMTEAMRDVYSCATAAEAGPELDRLVSWMAHSNVPEMRVVAKTLRLNREGILNYFGARLTNAYLEGANSLIQSIKKAARGFRNVEYFKTFIFLRLGGLNFDALARASA
jgi:alanyl-tRNA synthetase